MKLLKRDPNLGYLDNMLWIPKSLINVEGVKNALTFELQERDNIRCLQLWQEAEHHLIVPRAFWAPGKFPVQIIDCRPRSYVKTGVKSRIKLDHKPGPGGVLTPTGLHLQRDSIDALLKAQGGILQLACGRGKTSCALHFSALLNVPTLVAVDNTHLLHQWQEEIKRHLDVPGGVGLIQGGTKDWKKPLVLATYHSLANWADSMPEEVRRWFGLVIWDECHHVSAPTFSKSAPLFYGYRLGLSATPSRQDGAHVIGDHHLGKVIFKDVAQNCPPRISFKWTGVQADLEDKQVNAAVCDKNGEIHLGKLAGYFGSNRERLTGVVIPTAQSLVAHGHKVLVLSNSVDEVINLMTLWTAGKPDAPLYTDIPYPHQSEVGEDLPPVELKPAYAEKCANTIKDIKRNLARKGDSLSKNQIESYKERAAKYEELLKCYEVWKKTEKVYRQRQREFLKRLINTPSTAGLFTEAVAPEDRLRMLAERQVVFAIMKYGKEGLDDKKLSAILVSEPMSDRNTLQQVMGRPRDKANAELVFLEDDVGPLIGQCQKLRRHLRQWPTNEGGPFKFEMIGHPTASNKKTSDPWTVQPRVACMARTLRSPR